jgi:threonine dehydrogenase-like Zn-dependent dehydrogenase
MTHHTSASARPHVVIIGGGFGGLAAARALKHAPVRLTLIDRRNHHLFQPLLYQVASAALTPSDIAYPLRAALRRQQNARVLLANVTAIDLIGKTVRMDYGDLTYDYVIIATGATHAYFGHEAWAAYAPGQRGTGRTFLLDYSYRGQSPAVKEQIVDMAMKASGVRDTARVLHVSTNTVMTELKKEADLHQVNHAGIQVVQPEQVTVEMCRSENWIDGGA